MLCSKCFENPGVIALAERFGTIGQSRCENCSRDGGLHLDGDKQVEVFVNFFDSRRGAIYYPSNLRAREAEFTSVGIERDIEFDRSAFHDYRLLRKSTGLVLDWYGPATYLLGFTNYIGDLRRSLGLSTWSPSELDAEGTEAILARLLRGYPTEQIAEGTTIYRARRGAADLLEPSQFDSPPLNMVKGNGRFSCRSIETFYASFNVNACLVEMRTTPDDIVHTRIAVGILRAARALSVLNLCGEKHRPTASAVEDHDEVFESLDAVYTMMALTDPNEDNYEVSQAMSEYIYELGLDGFVHDSAMRCVTGQKTDSNLVLFGRPLAEGKLSLVSTHPVRIRNVQYNFELGFAWRNRNPRNEN